MAQAKNEGNSLKGVGYHPTPAEMSHDPSWADLEPVAPKSKAKSTKPKFYKKTSSGSTTANRTSKDKPIAGTDIRAALGVMTGASDDAPRAGPGPPNQDSVVRKSARGSSRSGSAPMTYTYCPIVFTEAHFATTNHVCRNVAATQSGLSYFLERVREIGEVGIAVVWNDLTNNHAGQTVKVCTPSQACHSWYCSCGRHTRVDRAFQPLLGACFSLNQVQERYFLPLAPCRSDLLEAVDANTTFVLPLVCEVPLSARWRALLRVLTDEEVHKVMYHAQLALLPILHGIRMHCDPPSGQSKGVEEIAALFDLRVAAFMCSSHVRSSDAESDESLIELSKLIEVYAASTSLPEILFEKPNSFDDQVTQMLDATFVELEAVVIMHRLLETQMKSMDKMYKSYASTEMKVIRLLASMELYGCIVDSDGLKKMQDKIERNLSILVSDAHQYAGQSFNLGSPAEVAHIVYKICKVTPPAQSRGKVHSEGSARSSSEGGKHLSTNHEHLVKCKDQHPIVDTILNFRSLSKMKGTYDWRNYLYKPHFPALSVLGSPSTDAFADVNAEGRIHSRWNNHKTRTGRLSSSQPNQQQVPKTTTIGKFEINIRELFRAPKGGYLLVTSDYAQIEMRVLAVVANERNLLDLFKQGSTSDIYKLMAAKVYSRPSIEAVSADDRKRVKKVVLAIIYGMGVVKVMEDLQITLKEANQLVGQFHAQYPNIRRFMSNVKSAAKRDGYVQTISGVRRYLPAITSSNTGVRAAAERAAINSVVQGSAADILKQAMCELDTEIAVWARRMGDRQVRMPRLIMSIHDEVIYEVHNSHIDHFVGMLKRVMEHDIPRHFNFPIPLVINVESGVDWGSAQPYVSPSTPRVRGAD